MVPPRTAQEWIHWPEVGEGARGLRRIAVLAATLALSLLLARQQFHGPVTEATLAQADTARQLADGQGFATLINYPQSAALLQERGVRFDPATRSSSRRSPPGSISSRAAELRISRSASCTATGSRT
jgi:hypothetical protein